MLVINMGLDSYVHKTNCIILYIRCSLYCCGLSRILPICCFRGFLRSDTLIGTVNVKLQPLETKCDIHDTFDVSYYKKIYFKIYNI